MDSVAGTDSATGIRAKVSTGTEGSTVSTSIGVPSVDTTMGSLTKVSKTVRPVELRLIRPMGLWE